MTLFAKGLVRKPVYVVASNGTPVAVSTDLTQNESLENSTTYVVDVALQNFPDPSVIQSGRSFSIIQGGLWSGKGLRQFTGILKKKDTSGYPNTVKLSAMGRLSKLRRAPLSDRDLTGKTDGEAVKAILDFCGISYTAGDIADSGYVLGQKKKIIWAKGNSGAQMLSEIDTVFAAATLEVGDGRIVRFFYDRAPDKSLIRHTFVKGADLRYYNGNRTIGDPDEIKNFWQITGLSFTSYPDGSPVTGSPSGDTKTCQAQYWGTARAVNPKIDGYSAPNTFSSELIQSEALAKLVAARMMRWWNREPDTFVLETINDPRVLPGDVIGVQDTTYGIDLAGPAEQTPYLVLSVDRTWDFMRLTCVGGPPGDLGTVTAGLNVCCGTQQADGTCKEFGINPALGSFPTPSLPPYPQFANLAYPVLNLETADLSRNGLDHRGDCTETAGLAGVAIEQHYDWEMSGIVTLTDLNDKFKVGVTATEGEYSLLIAAPGFYAATLDTPQAFELASPTYSYSEEGYLPLDTPIQWSLRWEDDARKLHCFIETDQMYHTAAVYEIIGGVMASAVTGENVSGSPIRTEEVVRHKCGTETGGTGLGLTWTTLTGTHANILGDDEVHLTDSQAITDDTVVYAAGADFPLDGSQRVQFTGHVHFSAAPNIDTDAPIITIGFVDNTSTLNLTAFQIQNIPSTTFGNQAFLYFYVNGNYVNELDDIATYGDAITDWDFALDLNFPAGTFTVDFNNGAAVLTGALDPVTSLIPYLTFAAGDVEIEADITNMVITEG